MTNSKFYNQTEAMELEKDNKCKVLVRGRNDIAPLGLFAKDDLKNEQKGIDEYVNMDGLF